MSTQTKTDRLYVRVTPREKKLLSAAARVAGLTVSRFIVKTSVEGAEDVLANRSHYEMREKDLDSILAAWNQPGQQFPETAKLMSEPSVFELAQKEQPVATAQVIYPVWTGTSQPKPGAAYASSQGVTIKAPVFEKQAV